MELLDEVREHMKSVYGNDMRTKQEYQEALDEIECNSVQYFGNYKLIHGKGKDCDDVGIDRMLGHSKLLQELIDNYKENNEK